MAVICQAYVEGISTRRDDELVKAEGIEGTSRSELSRLAAALDAKINTKCLRSPPRGAL